MGLSLLWGVGMRRPPLIRLDRPHFVIKIRDGLAHLRDVQQERVCCYALTEFLLSMVILFAVTILQVVFTHIIHTA